MDALLRPFHRRSEAGYLPPLRRATSGQIVDASLVAAPRQRDTEDEKAAIEAGKTAAEIRPEKPAKAAETDTDARWTLKASKGEVEADGTIKRDLAIPAFGCKSHIGIDRRHGAIRRQQATDAAAHDGARLREGLIDPGNTASDVRPSYGHVWTAPRAQGVFVGLARGSGAVMCPACSCGAHDRWP